MVNDVPRPIKAAAHRVHRRSQRPGTLAKHDEDPLAEGGARQVVQQAEAGLVRVVYVVDDQRRAGPGRGEPKQFRGAHEQPLVTNVAGLLRGAMQGTLDLVAIVVGEAVEQRRLATAEVRERLEHRRVRPGALDRGGSAYARAEAAILGALVDPPQQRCLADARRARHEQRAAAATHDGGEEPIDPAQLAVTPQRAAATAGYRSAGRRRQPGAAGAGRPLPDRA